MIQVSKTDDIQSKEYFRKELITIALPVALQNLMLALVGASDALMLGRFSQNAVSAVSLANQISFIMNLFIASVIGGCGVLITQYYGKKDYDTIKKCMSIGIKLSAIISFIFFIGAFFFSKSLMTIYTSDKELISIGSEYLKIACWSYLFSGISQVYLMVMKISDRASTSAAISVIAVILELTTCFCKGLSTGASIMIGRLFGQNRIDDAKHCGSKFCKIAVFCGIVNIVMLLIIGPIASVFFVLTDEARNYLIQMMFVVALYLFAYSLNTIITCGIFPAGGDTIYDAKSVMISKWCFSLPLALLGTFVFDWSVMLVYIIVMSDEIIKIPWIHPRYKKYIWVKNLTRDNA